MAIIAGASAFAVDPSKLSVIQWVGTYVSPLLLYLGIQTVSFDRRLFSLTWIAITVGALIPLLSGIAAYYSEWGMPTALELVTSRYDTERMSGYMQATFGNTGNTAAFLALLIPPWFSFLINRSAASGPRVLYAIALTVAFVHVLIVESRTLFIVLFIVLTLVAYYYRVRFAAALGGLLIAAAFLLPFLELGDRPLDLTVGALEGISDDQSVSERFEAMQIGRRLMLDHLALGVGPGNSSKVHIYTSAHQYWINQGEEIGVLGLLLSVLLTAAVFWRFLSFLHTRSNATLDDRRFAGIAGAAAYMLYGCIANMPLSLTVVNAWVGLFAVMLALADARYGDLTNVGSTASVD